MIEGLIDRARGDTIAYKNAKPAISFMVRSGKLPSYVAEFIADDYAGKVNPIGKTRGTAPKDFFRQIQAAFSVHALKESGVSERRSLAMVANVMTELRVAWPETFRQVGQSGIITPDQIRTAYRKQGKWLWPYQR